MRNIPENKMLTPKQQQAVVELIKPMRRSYKEVAEVLGISSRCLYNWQQETEFQRALARAQAELKDRVYSSSEFDIQLHTLDKALETEIKILSAIDITQAIINMAENQVRLRERLKALTAEVERLKDKVMERG